MPMLSRSIPHKVGDRPHILCKQTSRLTTVGQILPATSHSKKRILAIDVEYTHFKVAQHKGNAATSRQQSAAAWLAIVNDEGHCLLDSFIRPACLPEHCTWVGGVPLDRVTQAPALTDVIKDVRTLTNGALVVGHGLRKDLLALGLMEESGWLANNSEIYDLMGFQQFQNKSGSAFSLKVLAAKYLDKAIHEPGKRHNPIEDARIAMELYTKIVQPARITDYGDLVEFYTQQFLKRHQEVHGQQGGDK